MPFRPPLSLETLQEIQSRNMDSEDVRVLLWEIKRLRSIALRASQLCETMGNQFMGSTKIVRDALILQLEGEPVVGDLDRVYQKLTKRD